MKVLLLEDPYVIVRADLTIVLERLMSEGAHIEHMKAAAQLVEGTGFYLGQINGVRYCIVREKLVEGG